MNNFPSENLVGIEQYPEIRGSNFFCHLKGNKWQLREININLLIVCFDFGWKVSGVYWRPHFKFNSLLLGYLETANISYTDVIIVVLLWVPLFMESNQTVKRLLQLILTAWRENIMCKSYKLISIVILIAYISNNSVMYLHCDGSLQTIK